MGASNFFSEKFGHCPKIIPQSTPTQLNKSQTYGSLDVSKKHNVTLKNRYTRTPPSKREKENGRSDQYRNPPPLQKRGKGPTLNT
jgi:hypothetical protein